MFCREHNALDGLCSIATYFFNNWSGRITSINWNTTNHSTHPSLIAFSCVLVRFRHKSTLVFGRFWLKVNKLVVSEVTINFLTKCWVPKNNLKKCNTFNAIVSKNRCCFARLDKEIHEKYTNCFGSHRNFLVFHENIHFQLC